MQEQVQKYIKAQPPLQRQILEKIRELVIKLVPKGEECMSYGVPAFKLNKKNLLMYASFKEHVGIYPDPSTIEAFKAELADYETSKGTIKFSLKNKIPYDLIEKIVKYKSKK